MFFQELVLWITIVIAAVIVNFISAKKIGRYKYATKHILAYTIFIVPLLCIVVTKLTGIIKLDGGEANRQFKDIVENITLNIISNYLILIAFVLTFFIERKLKNKNEDKERLTDNYRALTEKYGKEEKLVSSGNTVYPVVSLGEGNICVYTKKTGINVDNIKICDQKNDYILPRLIENNFASIIKAYDTSVIYNNLCIRAKSLALENNHLMISTERTRYFYSLVTNRASDYDWAGDGMTVRSIYEPGPIFQPLERAYLSNHLGFNGFVLTNDDYVVFVKRSKDLSIAKRTYGDSIGASLKTKYALNNEGVFTAEKLVVAIIREISDELKIEQDNISSIHILGAYRDGLESGKPQLLFYAETVLSAEKIAEEFTNKTKTNLIEKINTKKRIKDQKERKRIKAEMKVIEDGSKLVWIRKDLLSDLQFHIDRIKFVNKTDDKVGFFEIKKGKKPKLLKNQYLSMVPSALASLAMFNHYLAKSEDK